MSQDVSYCKYEVNVTKLNTGETELHRIILNFSGVDATAKQVIHHIYNSKDFKVNYFNRLPSVVHILIEQPCLN